MNFYSLLRQLLFLLDPELAHHVTFSILKKLIRGPISKYLLSHVPIAPVNIMGLTFPNPIGLAAGLDQHGEYITALSALGFGFIEIGGLTPKAQLGNPKPRLFRLPENQALINRKGFPNRGIDYALTQVGHYPYPCILGFNIAKNFDTPLEKAVDDYLYCFKKAYSFADYVTLNISSPNTPGLRTLQNPEQLSSVLKPLKEVQHEYFQTQKKYVPLVVKISPDLTREELKEVSECLLSYKVDGVIATNTTISRPQNLNSRFSHETGGLSGQPLQSLSLSVLSQLHEFLDDNIPIIGCGGILKAKDALEKFDAGASLVQLYTGFIYQGPSLIYEIVTAFKQRT